MLDADLKSPRALVLCTLPVEGTVSGFILLSGASFLVLNDI